MAKVLECKVYATAIEPDSSSQAQSALDKPLEKKTLKSAKSVLECACEPSIRHLERPDTETGQGIMTSFTLPLTFLVKACTSKLDRKHCICPHNTGVTSYLPVSSCSLEGWRPDFSMVIEDPFGSVDALQELWRADRKEPSHV